MELRSKENMIYALETLANAIKIIPVKKLLLRKERHNADLTVTITIIFTRDYTGEAE